jgi:hypothetical protein
MFQFRDWLRRCPRLPARPRAASRRRKARRPDRADTIRLRGEQLETRVLLSICTVTSTGDFGAGILHDAINQVNTVGGLTVIDFNIPTSDSGYSTSTHTWTIQPLSALPGITNPMTLDATSQPGYASSPLI